MHSQLRTIGHLFLGSAMICVPIAAQIAEPILTRSAIPFGLGAGSVKLEYAGGIEPSDGGSQVIPEATLETGIASGLEFLVRFPLLRVTSASGGSTVVGGGQLAMGARYLVAGGAERRYAFSVQTIVEAPTGDTRLVGNATQVMPGVLVDWRPASRIAVHSNVIFDRSVGGTTGHSAFLEYSNAVVWAAANHFLPVFEVTGSSSTITGRTQLVGQPELIVPIGRHVELKAGLSLGLNSETQEIGLRTQVAWFWGTRK